MSYKLKPKTSYTHDDGKKPTVVFYNGTDTELSFSLRVYPTEPDVLHLFVEAPHE